jgi:hypothetical protein
MSQPELRRLAFSLTEREARHVLQAVAWTREQLQAASVTPGGVLARLGHSRALSLVGELQWIERDLRAVLGDVQEDPRNGAIS